jgi:PAS domain S-box-containing protein
VLHKELHTLAIVTAHASQTETLQDPSRERAPGAPARPASNVADSADRAGLPRHPWLPGSRLLAAIVGSSEDAIISSTPAGVILTWNRGAEVIFGYEAADTIGKHVSMLMAPDRLPDLAYFAGQVSRGVAVSQYQSLCRRKDGREFHVLYP